MRHDDDDDDIDLQIVRTIATALANYDYAAFRQQNGSLVTLDAQYVAFRSYSLV